MSTFVVDVTSLLSWVELRRTVNTTPLERTANFVRQASRVMHVVAHPTIVNHLPTSRHSVSATRIDPSAHVSLVVPFPGCDAAGTHMERGGRCICKYNVEGDRCDQCKRSHFYLNPTAPNGCLPCFCSGVSTECTSTDWKRQAVRRSVHRSSIRDVLSRLEITSVDQLECRAEELRHRPIRGR